MLFQGKFYIEMYQVITCGICYLYVLTKSGLNKYICIYIYITNVKI